MGGGLPGDVESTFAPSSPFAAAIADLFTQTLWVCAVIGIVVAAGIAYSLVAFRARPDGDEPRQVTGDRKLEVLWGIAIRSAAGPSSRARRSTRSDEGGVGAKGRTVLASVGVALNRAVGRPLTKAARWLFASHGSRFVKAPDSPGRGA
jgi:hypothetical protein